jgi:hypothetical protein
MSRTQQQVIIAAIRKAELAAYRTGASSAAHNGK